VAVEYFLLLKKILDSLFVGCTFSPKRLCYRTRLHQLVGKFRYLYWNYQFTDKNDLGANQMCFGDCEEYTFLWATEE